MLRQKFLADARLVIKPMQRGLRGNLHQVPIAFFIFGQHQKMVVGVAVRRGPRDDVIVFLADVKLAAHDRLDAGLMRRIHKMYRAKDIAVVGHGHGRHAQLVNALDQFLDVASAVEQRIITMQMQMDELIFAHEGST